MQILRSLVKGQQKRTKNRLLKLGNRRESPKIVIPETLVSYILPTLRLKRLVQSTHLACYIKQNKL